MADSLCLIALIVTLFQNEAKRYLMSTLLLLCVCVTVVLDAWLGPTVRTVGCQVQY